MAMSNTLWNRSGVGAPITDSTPSVNYGNSIFGNWDGHVKKGDALEAWQLGGINKGLPAFSSAIGFANDMEPVRQGSILNFIRRRSPGNIQSQVDSFGRRALARRLAMARQARLAGASAGVAPGAVANDAANQAAMDTAGYDQQVNSNEYQAQANQDTTNAISQAANPLLAQLLMALSGDYRGALQTEFQRPKDEGLLGTIMGLAPMFLSGGSAGGAGALASIFGGGKSKKTPSGGGGENTDDMGALLRAMFS